PRGRRCAAAGRRAKAVRLWDVASGQEIRQLPGHHGAVTAVAFAPDGRAAYSGSTDTTLLAWDVTTMSQGGKLPPIVLNAGLAETLWNDLAATDAHKAHRAVWTLVAAGEAAARELKKPVYLLDPKKVEQYIADLDSNKFAVREKARKELELMGKWIEGPLRNALKEPPSIEVRRRVELLLKKLAPGPNTITLDQERWRTVRVCGVLEQVGDAAAREQLAA